MSAILGTSCRKTWGRREMLDLPPKCRAGWQRFSIQCTQKGLNLLRSLPKIYSAARVPGSILRWTPECQFLCSTTVTDGASNLRSEEHTSELQSLMRISYAVF